MHTLAFLTGVLFWLVVFFCLMAGAYVFFRDDFGLRGLLEAGIFLGLLVVVGLPMYALARFLRERALAAAGLGQDGADRNAGPPAAAVDDSNAPRRRRRRSRRPRG